MRRFWFPLLWLPGLLAQAPDNATRACMREFGKSVRALEHSLGAGEHAETAAAAQLIAKLAPDLALTELPGGESERGDASWHADRVRATAAELASAAEAADLPLQQDAFGRLRAACAACHLQLRGPDDERGFWPGQRNALFGRVRVLTADGQPRDRADHLVLFLEGLPRQPAPPNRRVEITQRDRTFRPDLLVVPVGTTVSFPNHDTVFHNIFSLSKPQPFDLELYGPGETRMQQLGHAGLVKIYCNIHPEMVAHIVVLEHGSAVTATPGGFFCISDLPDGEFKLRCWSEFGGDQEQSVMLGGQLATRLDLQVQETKRRLPHRNKHGRPYREKY